MDMWAGPRLPYISNNFPFSQPLHPSNVWQDEKLCRGRSKSRNRRSLTRGERGRLQACGDLTIFDIRFTSQMTWRIDDIHSTIWLTQKHCLTWFFYVSSLWSLRLLMSLDLPDFSNEISCQLCQLPSRNVLQEIMAADIIMSPKTLLNQWVVPREVVGFRFPGCRKGELSLQMWSRIVTEMWIWIAKNMSKWFDALWVSQKSWVELGTCCTLKVFFFGATLRRKESIKQPIRHISRHFRWRRRGLVTRCQAWKMQFQGS